MRQMLRRLRACEDANVAVIFALSLLPLLLAVGSAVDYSRAANLHSQLQADTDAAALAACKSPLTSRADLKEVAQKVLNGFMPGKITIDDRTFVATNNPRSIDMTTVTSYTPQFIKLPRPMTVSTTSVCAAGENFYEIALVLDTTGSMSNWAGTKTKIEALRESAAAFVNTMFANFDADHVRISIVPFAASVRVDPSAYATASWLDTSGQSSIHWQNVLDASTNGFTSRFGVFTKLKAKESNWGWAGCLESLPYPYNTKDETPSSGTPDTLYVPLFAPDEYGNSSDEDYNNNSYIDDGTSNNGTCAKNASSRTTRMGQSCKYKSPTDVRDSRPGPNWGCTSRAITRLTNSQTALTTEISKLTANGQTNIHEGLHWGWRTISKTGVFNDAEAYGTKNVTKVIVLMTDGMNTWTGDKDIYVGKSQYSAYGYFNNADGSKTEKRLPTGYTDLNDTDDSKSSAKARKAIDQLTRETCTNARARDVAIYTVGFSVSGDSMDEAGLQLLKDCSGETDRSFLATDAASLNKSFEDIAKGIGEMRITK